MRYILDKAEKELSVNIKKTQIKCWFQGVPWLEYNLSSLTRMHIAWTATLWISVYRSEELGPDVDLCVLHWIDICISTLQV